MVAPDYTLAGIKFVLPTDLWVGWEGKMFISFVVSPLINYTFFASLNEIIVIFIPNIRISSTYYELICCFLLAVVSQVIDCIFFRVSEVCS